MVGALDTELAAAAARGCPVDPKSLHKQ